MKKEEMYELTYIEEEPVDYKSFRGSFAPVKTGMFMRSFVTNIIEKTYDFDNLTYWELWFGIRTIYVKSIPESWLLTEVSGR